ncbi:unnamed protein product, partial [Polarella glacialis]
APSAAEAKYLGCLAMQAARLRRLECVDEVTSYRQSLPGGGIEYQLLIELTTANGIRLRITVAIDPSTPAAQRALAGGAGSSVHRGLRCSVEWMDQWEGTFDGPLAPGVIEETCGALTLSDLLSGGGDLCDCVRALVRMLLRRDGPPRLGASVDVKETEPAYAQPRRPRATDELPFPKTCGICWTPQGDLLCFKSLQNVAVPFPRRWT